MSLLGDLWEGFMAWVRTQVDSASATLRTWVEGITDKINEGLSNLGGAWDNFTTKTLPDLWKAIQDAANNVVETIENNITNVTEFVTNVYNYGREYVTNVNNYITEKITNEITNVTKNITQVVGADQDWVRNFVSGLIPADFVKDPLGYITGAVDLSAVIPADFIKDPLGYIGAALEGFLEPLIQGVIQSIAEGIEEAFKAMEEEEEYG